MRSFTKAQAEAVVAEHGKDCFWCKAPLVSIVIDHLVPYSKGGETTVENGVPSCVRCNQDKKDSMPEKYAEKIARRNRRGRDLTDLSPSMVEEEPVHVEQIDIAARRVRVKGWPSPAAEWDRRCNVVLRLLSKLDPDNDDHWRKDGAPRMLALMRLRPGFRIKQEHVHNDLRHMAAVYKEVFGDDRYIGAPAYVDFDRDIARAWKTEREKETT